MNTSRWSQNRYRSPGADQAGAGRVVSGLGRNGAEPSMRPREVEGAAALGGRGEWRRLWWRRRGGVELWWRALLGAGRTDRVARAQRMQVLIGIYGELFAIHYSCEEEEEGGKGVTFVCSAPRPRPKPCKKEKGARRRRRPRRRCSRRTEQGLCGVDVRDAAARCGQRAEQGLCVCGGAWVHGHRGRRIPSLCVSDVWWWIFDRRSIAEIKRKVCMCRLSHRGAVSRITAVWCVLSGVQIQSASHRRVLRLRLVCAAFRLSEQRQRPRSTFHPR